MYARTLFRGAKMCKIGKKGMFLDILTNLRKDMMDKLTLKCIRAGPLGPNIFFFKPPV